MTLTEELAVVTTEALCAEVDTEIFFIEQGGNPGPARQVCAACTVRVRCLDVALAFGPELHGIWGGTTAMQRRRLRHLQDAA